ncbi:MAG TPA: MmcQ/YjbR family DNA-binding protein [Acidimicrobiales bacterium]|nr:MmcQ/YjbR family DNA-binding protein [Acidimicrobiales bacterium]
MKLEDARRLALALPEVTEEPHFDMTSWRIRKRLFVTAPPEGDRLHVFLDEEEVRAFLAEDPAAFEELWWGKRLSGVRVKLAEADPARVEALLGEAWLRRAPKALAASWRPAEEGS